VIAYLAKWAKIDDVLAEEPGDGLGVLVVETVLVLLEPVVDGLPFVGTGE